MDVRGTHQKSYEKENTWINRFEPYINKRGYCAAHDPAGHKAADQEKDQDGRYDGGNGIKDPPSEADRRVFSLRLPRYL